MSITANRFPGVRAALCHNAEAAKMSRAHNDANVLVLGARFVDESDVPAILDAFLDTPFEGGRHLRRVRKIEANNQGETLDR
jgi:ribose 5-phosphate isomerase B